MKLCRWCKEEMHEQASVCPHCRKMSFVYTTNKVLRPIQMVGRALVMLVIAVMVYCAVGRMLYLLFSGDNR